MSVVAAIAAESDGVGICQGWRVSASEPPAGRRRVPSRAKVRANRRNARRSTGPRSAAGKARARMNALAHGAYCADLLLPGEDAALLEDQRRQFVAAWAPADACELLLVEQMLAAAWRLRRVGATENGLHRWAARMAWDRRERERERIAGTDAEPPPPAEAPGLSVPGEGLWYCLQYPDAGGRELETLGRLEQRLLGTVLRCSRELRQLKLLRLREGRDAAEEREEGEPGVADAGAGTGDAADRSNAVDASDGGDAVGASAAAAVPPLAATQGRRASVRGAASGRAPAAPTAPAAPAASTAPAPPPQPRARAWVGAEHLAVASFRTAGGGGSTTVPLFEPADPTSREAAWCGASPIPIRGNER